MKVKWCRYLLIGLLFLSIFSQGIGLTLAADPLAKGEVEQQGWFKKDKDKAERQLPGLEGGP